MLSAATKRAVNKFLNKIPISVNGELSFISRSMSGISAVQEQKINVQGFDINYVKVGSGSHPVLLLPGAVGSIWTDFKPQITNLDKDKFSIIAWDPPGYGNSRPPNRTFGLDFFARDASVANDLMKAIGHEKFSLIGWSDGGITSFFLAASYPDSVEKAIVVGANAYILPEELTIYKSIRNIDTWSERMRAPLISVYGEGYFRSTWASWVDGMEEIYETKKGDICMNMLRDIKCPTLIVHGAKDAVVHADHPGFLAKNIKNSKVHIFDKGGHNLHLRYHEEFNDLATKFLLGNE